MNAYQRASQLACMEESLHRTWFTWVSWFFYAWSMDQEYDQWLFDMRNGK